MDRASNIDFPIPLTYKNRTNGRDLFEVFECHPVMQRSLFRSLSLEAIATIGFLR
jgi:hypothetical protein